MLQTLGHLMPAIVICVLFVLAMIYIRLARRWGAIAKTAADPEKGRVALAKEWQYDKSWMVCVAGIVIIGIVLQPWQ